MMADITVEYVSSTPDGDLLVVNAARASFGKEHKRLEVADIHLINFLARGMTADNYSDFLLATRGAVQTEDHARLSELMNEWRRTPEHSSPFRHPSATFRVKIPLFVARQIGKHQVGMTWSEESRRYIDDEPEFYWPDQWRKKAEDKKQGSGGPVDDLFESAVAYMKDRVEDTALTWYGWMIHRGFAPEQARMILPQNMMTTVVWTGTLLAWAHFCRIRDRDDVQWETREVARSISNQMAGLFPHSWKALMNYGV